QGLRQGMIAERDLALVEQLRKRLADLQAQAAKPPAGDDESVLGGDFDARRRLAELEKQIGGEQLRTLEDLAKRRDGLAQLELQQQQRIAEARALTTQQTAQVELEALRRREALARQAHDTEVRLAQT